MFGSKEIIIRSGKRLIIRPMRKEDEKALFEFFSRLPNDLLIFIRHNVRDPQVIKEWVDHLNYERVLPIVALDNDKIVADVTLHRIPYGWKRHIGQVRIVVDPAYHGQGLATAILNELVELGAEFGLEKLWAEVPLDSIAAVKAFKNAGFRCKAVVEGLVKDLRGNNVDILIMVCDIEQYYDSKWLRKKESTGA
ncbi:MAG: GNAT family N-acetyltransferase [Syntrophobacterales bacterium]|nr:GNAT family N-acetyltransferase [Syntrophobacterales bacterium]